MRYASIVKKVENLEEELSLYKARNADLRKEADDLKAAKTFYDDIVSYSRCLRFGSVADYGAEKTRPAQG